MTDNIKSTQKAEEKRNKIISVALDLFFLKGYEATTVRMIQNRANQPIGLFYYYFKSKDELFEEALQVFLSKYELQMKKIVEDQNRGNKLSNYLNFVNFFTQNFKKQYSGKIHWSVLSALWEYSIRLMRRYVLQILSSYVNKRIIFKTQSELEIVANLIAFSVGGSIMYQSEQAYERQKADLFKNVALLTGIPIDRL